MSLISHKMHAGTDKKANPIDRSLSNLRIIHSIIGVLDNKPTTLTNMHLTPLKIKIYPRKKSSTPSIGRITVPELKHWPQIFPLALRKPLRCPRKPILSPPKFHLFCPAVNHVKPLATKYERQNSALSPLHFNRSIVPLFQNFFAHDSSRFLSQTFIISRLASVIVGCHLAASPPSHLRCPGSAVGALQVCVSPGVVPLDRLSADHAERNKFAAVRTLDERLRREMLHSDSVTIP